MIRNLSMAIIFGQVHSTESGDLSGTGNFVESLFGRATRRANFNQVLETTTLWKSSVAVPQLADVFSLRTPCNQRHASCYFAHAVAQREHFSRHGIAARQGRSVKQIGAELASESSQDPPASLRETLAHAIDYNPSGEIEGTSIPDERGIYAISDVSGKLMYIGLSKKIRSSLEAHAKRMGHEAPSLMASVKYVAMPGKPKQDLQTTWKHWMDEHQAVEKQIPPGNFQSSPLWQRFNERPQDTTKAINREMQSNRSDPKLRHTDDQPSIFAAAVNEAQALEKRYRSNIAAADAKLKGILGPQCRLVKLTSVDGRLIYVIDGAVDTETQEGVLGSLENLPFSWTEVARPDTKDFKHMAANHDIDGFTNTKLYRTIQVLIKSCFPSSKDAPLRPTRVYTNAITCGDVAFVHRDSLDEAQVTALFYPNSNWASELQGETVFYNEDGEIIEAVEPRPGRLCIFTGTIQHKGSPPSRLFNGRRYTTALKFEPNRVAKKKDLTMLLANPMA